MKLNLEKHQAVHYQLYEFEEDEIEDFEGHAAVDVRDEPDAEDMTWLFPTKGPGKFRDLNKKKKDKKKKANKKKQNESKKN